ncbi:nibrin-like [Sitodiplosis mosellana]|uniref:nibrin-like n=1 Tax=Sitodiplosis mosellana TaxID=263140 RepID=UPI002444418C|nr:nibrin-like [Sitodiplosis mosellana]
MWVFIHITTDRRFFLLNNTRKYTVGRVPQCDLRLADDTSVSREHAVIHRSSSGVRVEDTGSKYGVFINDGINTNTEIAKNTAIDLQIGNIVRFGRLENTFRLENVVINACTSSMQPDETDKLSKHLKILDGKLLPVWSTDCTHLVMTNVTVTVKVLQSLAHGIPIVSPDYFEACIECATAQHELPNVNEFVPTIVEPYIIKEPKMMEVHIDRQRLFQNKTFVFMVKRHMEKFEPIIRLAAGKCINMEEDKVRKALLIKSEYIPVQYTPSLNSQCSSDIENIVRYIESNGRRLVSETEIGLAIIHRAIDRFCNPDRQMTISFQPTPVNTNEIVKDVYTDETPHITKPEPPASSMNLVIPESADLTGTEPNNNLRSDEAADLGKPSTSSTGRRSTRSSTKSSGDDALNVSTKMPTPKKNPKRKHTDQEDGSEKPGQSTIDSGEHSVPEKKQKTQNAVESQGENSSGLFIAPLPPQSPSDHNFSGFISTQSRKRKATQQQEQAVAPPSTPESSKITRKRAVRMLTADSDEEKDDDDGGNLFKFSRKSKRSKTTSKQTQQRTPQRNKLAESDDDDDDGGFNFTQRKPRPSQTKRLTQQNANENDVVDAASVAASQNSYKKPFQQTVNRSFNRTMTPIEITCVPTCNVEWISYKMKKEMNLDQSHEKPSQPSQPSSSVKIKEEKLEEWELTDEQKKRQWIKSMANVFEVRKVELNTTRRSVQADETDSLFSNSGSASYNKSKNFKKFVKKNNYIPRTEVIKTNPVPIIISTYARI